MQKCLDQTARQQMIFRHETLGGTETYSKHTIVRKKVLFKRAAMKEDYSTSPCQDTLSLRSCMLSSSSSTRLDFSIAVDASDSLRARIDYSGN